MATVSDLVSALKKWGYVPGPYAVDYDYLFSKDFEWGRGAKDNAILEAKWAEIADCDGVVWLRFGNTNKAVPDDVWEGWPCILRRTRFVGPMPTTLTSILSVFSVVEEEGLFALPDPDHWMLLVMKHDALRVDPLGVSEK